MGVKVTVASNYGLDMRGLDFSSMWYAYDTAYNSKLFRTYYSNGFIEEFKGSGFTYDKEGIPTGGTASSYAAFSDGQRLFVIDGASISVKSMVNVSLTYSTEDDLKLIAAELTGNDTFIGGNLQDVVITYGGNDVLYGNGGNDALIGGTGNDKVFGGSGIDYLYGEAGNDTLNGGTGADILSGGTGSDTASYAGATKGVVANLTKPSLNTNDAKGDSYTSIENLTGSSYADVLTGNTGTNTLSGGSGADKLYGGLGKDIMIGGSGRDFFVFDTKLGSTNIDTIDDFIVKDDTIFLDDDIFTKAGKVGDLTTVAFYAGTKAHDTSDRVIYDTKTGKLFYDADGSGKGAAIQFALLDHGLKLTAADFDIIA